MLFRSAFVILAVLSLLAAPVMSSAQTIVNDEPQYWLGLTVGFNRHAFTQPATTTQPAGNLLQTISTQAIGGFHFGVKVAPKTYSFSSIESTSAGSTSRTGIAQILITKDYFTLMAIGDAGMATENGNVGGAFSTGGIVAYDISRWTKVPGTYAVALMRVMKSSVNDLQPVFSFGFGKTF